MITARPWVAILGPTASGKTDVAVRLAERFGGEIVSCDSMQVYRGLDVGTAKPSIDLRRRVPHHLIDVVDIHERYDLNRYLQDARKVLAALLEHGRLPVLTGGTGLYARSLIYGAVPPPADPALRRVLEHIARTPAGLRKLERELAAADPACARIVAGNPRRLVRAVERLRLTGHARPPPLLRSSPPSNVLQFVLLPQPDRHKRRIRKRVQYMLDNGWIDETITLAQAGLFHTPTARQALGYRTIHAYLNRRGLKAPVREPGPSPALDANGPTAAPDDLVALLVRETWAYARRQRTWFRNQHPGAFLVSLRPDADIDRIAEALASEIKTFLTRRSLPPDPC